MKVHAIPRVVTGLVAALVLSGGLPAATVGPAQAHTYDDPTSASQVSPISVTPYDRWWLENTATSLCMEVAFGNTRDFTPTTQFTCASTAFTEWQVTYTGVPLTYAVQSVHSGKCLDVPGASKEDLAPVVQYGCHGGASQRWRFTCGFGSNECTIQNVNSGKCLDAGFNSDQLYSFIVQKQCPGAYQTWRVIHAGR